MRSGLLAAAAGLLAMGGCSTAAGAPGTRTVALDVRHSRFSASMVRVRPGETVRFVVRNHDPIEHELIVGDDEVQRLHEAGTDRLHQGPGAVSVAPGATAATTYTFPSSPSSSRLLFGCHLPGHWAYGMRGSIVISSSR
jgi:uncharacterized cupredoxin-like copper-binding protein